MFKEMLIGEEAEICYGSSYFKGTIIDEKKNIIIIKTKDKEKKIPKKPSIIKIGNKTIQGKAILKRFEDRIK